MRFGTLRVAKRPTLVIRDYLADITLHRLRLLLGGALGRSCSRKVPNRIKLLRGSYGHVGLAELVVVDQIVRSESQYRLVGLNGPCIILGSHRRSRRRAVEHDQR